MSLKGTEHKESVMSDMGLGLPQFEAFLEDLNVPDSCVLNKPLFKKMF